MIIPKERVSVEVAKIKGSRFIGYLDRVLCAKDISVFLNDVQNLHSRASHYCYAWRIDAQERSSDDGEPKGSAGPPILKRLRSKDCFQAMLVVVRYFGGTKLGVGGLVRAYGSTAAAVLQKGSFEEYREWCSLSFSYLYSDTGRVEGVLSRFDHKIESKNYSKRVHLKILLLRDQKDLFVSCIVQESGGRVHIDV